MDRKKLDRYIRALFSLYGPDDEIGQYKVLWDGLTFVHLGDDRFPELTQDEREYCYRLAGVIVTPERVEYYTEQKSLEKRWREIKGATYEMPNPINRVITEAAAKILNATGDDPNDFFNRHLNGDWGDIPDEDVKMNERSLRRRGMLLSQFRTKDGTIIWVITDPGWETTTILLPEDY